MGSTSDPLSTRWWYICDRCAGVTWLGTTEVHTAHGDEMWCDACCDEHSVMCEKCGESYEEGSSFDSDGVCIDCRIDRAEPDYDYKHEEGKNRGRN